MNLNRPFLETTNIGIGPEYQVIYKEISPTFLSEVIQRVKADRFDSIRVNVNVSPLLNKDDKLSLKQFEKIKTFVELALTKDLRVVVDLHTLKTNATWSTSEIEQDQSGSIQNAYLRMVAMVAESLSVENPSLVALEMFNEPTVCDAKGDLWWSQFQQKLFKEARRNAPRLPLVVTGDCWGSIDGLVKLNASQFDQNTFYSFHFYEPHIFTQEGSPSYGYLSFINRLKYPPEIQDEEVTINAAFAAIRATGNSVDVRQIIVANFLSSIREYFRYGPERINERINLVINWANQQHIPTTNIVVGEFGVRRDYNGNLAASEKDRAAWLRSVRSKLSNNQMPYFFYALVGPWGLTSEDLTERSSQNILTVLGLM